MLRKIYMPIKMANNPERINQKKGKIKYKTENTLEEA